ncbi:ATP-binding protein [Anaerococcus sp.]|uniref:ATP-binding protein n=1 Tax=Anaerococcus sp. TaxID=1872515 RepID=UPI002A90BEB0|nr:ATP-binding protein [Anaerococcus sp.]MDY6127512.1 ATP-binding protein [Anaerococcus sp.]
MRDISLHLLDLVQNSISAGAKLVQVIFRVEGNKLEISIIDDGCGMSPEMLQKVINPFTTRRTTRKVGLGIPLFVHNAELTGGHVDIESHEGVGTCIKGLFYTDNIDCLPLGDLAGTVMSLIIADPDKPEYIIRVENMGDTAELNTSEMREVLAGVQLNEPSVLSWIEDTINQEIVPLIERRNL